MFTTRTTTTVPYSLLNYTHTLSLSLSISLSLSPPGTKNELRRDKLDEKARGFSPMALV
jgi:hypothetical protein